MKVDELERHIIDDKRQGRRPYMVSATGGTTVLGAFDPLNAIADVCEKYELWMHVDVSTGFLTQKPQVRLGGFGTKIFT
jgi:glutamate decarboxylase